MNLVHDQKEMCDLHMSTEQWFRVICLHVTYSMRITIAPGNGCSIA
jgi:hypothetical protein